MSPHIAHTTTMSDDNHTPIEKDESVINELLTKSLKSAAKIAEQKEREEQQRNSPVLVDQSDMTNLTPAGLL